MSEQHKIPESMSKYKPKGATHFEMRVPNNGESIFHAGGWTVSYDLSLVYPVAIIKSPEPQKRLMTEKECYMKHIHTCANEVLLVTGHGPEGITLAGGTTFRSVKWCYKRDWKIADTPTSTPRSLMVTEGVE